MIYGDFDQPDIQQKYFVQYLHISFPEEIWEWFCEYHSRGGGFSVVYFDTPEEAVAWALEHWQSMFHDTEDDVCVVRIARGEIDLVHLTEFNSDDVTDGVFIIIDRVVYERKTK